jgi:uncharacterized membrane protein YgcG
VSTVLATAFLLVTTSLVGHTPIYMWLLSALCSAYAALDSMTPPKAQEIQDATGVLTGRATRRLMRSGMKAR